MRIKTWEELINTPLTAQTAVYVTSQGNFLISESIYTLLFRENNFTISPIGLNTCLVVFDNRDSVVVPSCWVTDAPLEEEQECEFTTCDHCGEKHHLTGDDQSGGVSNDDHADSHRYFIVSYIYDNETAGFVNVITSNRRYVNFNDVSSNIGEKHNPLIKGKFVTTITNIVELSSSDFNEWIADS